MSHNAKFVEGSTMRHIMVMTASSSMGLIAIFAVDLIDMIFLGWLGEQAIAAAIGFAGTLLFFATSVNIGVSIAIGALVSQALGRENEEEARRYATNVMVFGFIVSAFFTFVFLLFSFRTLQNSVFELKRDDANPRPAAVIFAVFSDLN